MIKNKILWISRNGWIRCWKNNNRSGSKKKIKKNLYKGLDKFKSSNNEYVSYSLVVLNKNAERIINFVWILHM